LSSYETTGSAFDAAGNFYVTSFGLSNMSRFDNSGGLLAPSPFVTNDSGSDNESIVFDASGNMYIGQADGTRDVIKRDSAGNFLARYDVATDDRGSDWIDLAADQHTLYYTSEGRRILRYDLATSTQLTDFATLPGSGTAFALRILSDGGVLVADTLELKRLDSTGAVVKTYDTAGEDFFFAMNLDPDGTSFWTAGYSTGMIYRFDIATGTLLTSFDSSKFTTLAGLSVYGEITEGGPGGRIPEPGSIALVALGGLGLLFGARRRRKSRVG
jgi:sugar lactone lactonase YvrE